MLEFILISHPGFSVSNQTDPQKYETSEQYHLSSVLRYKKKVFISCLDTNILLHLPKIHTFMSDLEYH